MVKKTCDDDNTSVNMCHHPVADENVSTVLQTAHCELYRVPLTGCSGALPSAQGIVGDERREEDC